MSRRKREIVARAAAAKVNATAITGWKKFINTKQLGIAAAALLLIVFVVAGAFSGKYKHSFAFGNETSTTDAATQPAVTGTPQLSKEYIYAGGRMLAVEEAGSSTGGGATTAPSNLAAIGGASQVTINWNAPGSGSVDHYEVERGVRTNGQIQYSPVAACQNVGATTPSCTDSGVALWTAYLYRVRAVSIGNTPSTYSNSDLATATAFADDPLVAGVTTMRAQHITELRQAVDGVRTLAGLATGGWSAGAAQNSVISAQHITELRTKLNEALVVLGLSVTGYEDANLTVGITFIKRVHIEQLRTRVK